MDCRICQRPAREAFILRSKRHDAHIPVFRCAPCDAYFSAGGPVNYDNEDLGAYYRRYEAPIRARYDRVFAQVERLAPRGRFIDIGAGMGYSLAVGRDRGWTASGLEPNIALVRDARSRGLDVDHGYLDEQREGQYEFVMADNVLEHVPDPAGFLANARRLTAPGGVLLIAIPPMDWLRKALGSSAWVRERVDQPQLNIFRESDEHLNMMGRKAMSELASRVGLELLPLRFHHSKVFDNAAFRTLGLDDGYYFLRTAA